MLDFRLNGRSFLLDETTSVKIKWVNPACYHDKLIGDVGLGITLPDNRTNRALLGNPERFDKYSSGSDRKFPGFEILHSGVQLLRGPLVLNNGFSGWLQSEYGALREEQKEKKITEMPWPEDAVFSNKASYDDSEDDYNTRVIMNPGFWEGKGKEETIKEDYVDENGEDQERDITRSVMTSNQLRNYAGYINNHTLPVIMPGCVISPFLYLRYVLKESLRMNKWFIGRNDMVSDGDTGLNLWKNIVIYNNFNILDIVTETVIEIKPRWDPYTGLYYNLPVAKITNADWTLLNFKYKNLLPKIKYEDLILGVQNFLNFIFRFRNDSRVDIIDRNKILNGAAFDIDRWHRKTWEKENRKNVKLKFVSAYDKDDQLFASNYEDLTDRRDDFKEPVDTYEDLEDIVSPENGELRLVRSQNRIYEYKWKAEVFGDAYLQEFQVDATGWEYVSSGPQPYLYGDGEEIEEIKSELSTLQIDMFGTPRVWQKGNLASIKSSWNDFSGRLIPGNTELWKEGLYWEGDNGLFKTRWERWAHFWKNRLEVTAEFDLPLNMISYLVDNITGKYRTREGEFIIEEMECEFGMNKIGRTTIRGYKI